jgi:hypothetical protein
MPRDFLLLYDEYYPKLYAYVLANVRHQQTAEDIVQQTFGRSRNTASRLALGFLRRKHEHQYIAGNIVLPGSDLQCS